MMFDEWQALDIMAMIKNMAYLDNRPCRKLVQDEKIWKGKKENRNRRHPLH